MEKAAVEGAVSVEIGKKAEKEEGSGVVRDGETADRAKEHKDGGVLTGGNNVEKGKEKDGGVVTVGDGVEKGKEKDGRVLTGSDSVEKRKEQEGHGKRKTGEKLSKAEKRRKMVEKRKQEKGAGDEGVQQVEMAKVVEVEQEAGTDVGETSGEMMEPLVKEVEAGEGKMIEEVQSDAGEGVGKDDE